MQCWTGDDAAGADVFARQFELGLYQDQKIGAGLGGLRSGRQDFADGDEGDVEDDQIDWFGDVAGAKVAGIAGDSNDAAVVAQLPGQLIDIHVHGVDAHSSVLEEAIGESAGGCSDVQANARVRIDGKVLQSAFQLHSASADKFSCAAAYLDARFLWEACAGFVGARAVH